MRSTGTTPEMSARALLSAAGAPSCEVNVPGLPGRPDIVFRRERLAVFVNGCFWHGCPRCRLPRPRVNAAFWAAKLDRNARRDIEVCRALQEADWRVATIWECAIDEGVAAVLLLLGSP